MNHPFRKTEYTDIEVKLEDTTLYLSSDLLNDLTRVNSVTGPTCSDMDDEPCSSGSTEKKENETIDLSEYNSYDVIEFFKHLYPEQHAKLTDRNNLKTILQMCKRFKVEWLTREVEEYLVKQVEIEDNNLTEAHLSMYLSLAEEFDLKYLKEEIKDDLEFKFAHNDYRKQCEPIFHMVSQYNLKRVHKSFEKSMLKKSRDRYKPYTRKAPDTDVVRSYVDYLFIADNHHYTELKKFLLNEKYCVLSSWMEDERMENLSESTLFEIAKLIIAKIFNPHCKDDFPLIVQHMLDFIYTERFQVKSEDEKEAFINMKVTSESEDESSSSDDESSESENEQPSPTENNENIEDGIPKKEKKSNPFEATPTTDVEVVVDKTTLYLQSSILRHCSPVFNAMLGGSFKEGNSKKINLPKKDLPTVIEFFEFFYAERKKKLKASSDFEGLLALCQEYLKSIG